MKEKKVIQQLQKDNSLITLTDTNNVNTLLSYIQKDNLDGFKKCIQYYQIQDNLFAISLILNPQGDSTTILSRFCSKGAQEILKFLLTNYKDTILKYLQPQSMKDKDPAPLIVAINNNQEHIIKMLIEAGVQVESIYKVITENGRLKDCIPVVEACKLRNLELFKLFLPNTKQLNIRDSSGNSPLNIAAYYRNTAVVDYLVNTLHADVNTVNFAHETPLYSVCRSRGDGTNEERIAIVTCLLNQPNIDLSKKSTRDKQTALEAAKKSNFTDGVKLIEEKIASKQAGKTGDEKPTLSTKCSTRITDDKKTKTVKKSGLQQFFQLFAGGVAKSKSKQQKMDPLTQLKRDLKAYIERIEKHKTIENKIDFAYGFHFFKDSRAVSREANYLLACDLLTRLECDDPQLNEIFTSTNIEQLRQQLIEHNNIDIRHYPPNTSIGSIELNEIIHKGMKLST